MSEPTAVAEHNSKVNGASSSSSQATSEGAEPERAAGGTARGGRVQGPGGAGRSAQGWIRIAAILGIILGVFLIMRTVPVGEGITRMESWIDSLGVWGPVIFAGIYIVATVLLLPGGLLTIAAGAIFGLFWGFVAVSIGSTIGASLAFLIGRHLARKTIQEQTARYPKFGAIDRAISEGGWRIVAMLRLVPLFPFNVGNYLFGLTAVGFWPYAIASWIAMMPGTLVYVYLGNVGRLGVQAAAGEAGRHPLEWVVLIVGFIVALAVTVYITRLAERKLAEQTELDPEETGAADADPRGESGGDSVENANNMDGSSGRGRTVALAGVAVVMLTLGACATLTPNWLARFFGPPQVTLAEHYDAAADGEVFDHSAFDRLLRRYVEDADGGGWIDYAGLLENDRDALKRYIDSLAKVDFEALSRDEKLALLINAYNAFTIELILEYWNDGKLRKITDIPTARRWVDERWNVGGNIWSLDQIEHEQIRPKFKEPRIHWAVVCAAIGCPPLRSEAYIGARLDAQLADQGRIVHAHERWLRFDAEANIIHLTMLYNWYGDDFVQTDGSVLQHAAKFVPALRAALEADRPPGIRWIEYDWSLNQREMRDDDAGRN